MPVFNAIVVCCFLGAIFTVGGLVVHTRRRDRRRAHAYEASHSEGIDKRKRA